MTARTFTPADAAAIARRLYGIDAAAAPLPGYYDQNFLLEPAAGPRAVLKIARAGQRREVIDLQLTALEHLASKRLGFRVPRALPTRDGRPAAVVDERIVRLFDYIEGSAWSSLAAPEPRQLRRLGAVVGSLMTALDDFTHPEMRRVVEWDMRRLSLLRPLVSAVERAERRVLAHGLLDHFERGFAPRLAELPQGVIHGDVNNDNVLVDDRGGIAGLIDFEDVKRTAVVCELGIALAYAMLGRADPAAAAGHVVAGFEQSRPLLPAERDVVLDIAQARLIMSVLKAAEARRVDPGNAYRTANEAAGWRVLEAVAAASG